MVIDFVPPSTHARTLLEALLPNPAIPEPSPAGRRLLAATRVVLEHPFFPENVGAAARAMNNCGMSRLLLVDGVDPRHPNARKMAVRSEGVLDQARTVSSIAEAVDGASLIIGTTRMPYPGMRLLTPRDVMPLVAQHGASGEIVWLFGNEKNGLSREALLGCHQVVRIPCVAPDASLNLAQAVMTICYEVMLTALDLQEALASIPLTVADEEIRQLAEHLEEALERSGFLKPHQRPRREAILRRVLSRVMLDPDEAAVLHGVARRLKWRAEHGD
jgi:TrmH family RNA methyltransferase